MLCIKQRDGRRLSIILTILVFWLIFNNFGRLQLLPITLVYFSRLSQLINLINIRMIRITFVQTSTVSSSFYIPINLRLLRFRSQYVFSAMRLYYILFYDCKMFYRLQRLLRNVSYSRLRFSCLSSSFYCVRPLAVLKR